MGNEIEGRKKGGKTYVGVNTRCMIIEAVISTRVRGLNKTKKEKTLLGSFVEST